MTKQNKDFFSLSVKINEEERKMIEILKTKYSINISQLFKNYLREYFDKATKSNG